MSLLRLADDVALVVDQQDAVVRRDGAEPVRIPSAGPALRRIVQALAVPRQESSLRAAMAHGDGTLLQTLVEHGAVVVDEVTAHLVDLHHRTVVAREALAAPAGEDDAFLAREAGVGHLVALPEGRLGLAPLADVLQARRSMQWFTGDPVPLDALATLLAWSAGTNRAGDRWRVHPSGGALYPVETHLLALRVDDLGPAVYRYRPAAHGLAKRAAAPPRAELERWLEGHPVGLMACLVLLTIDFSRPSLARRYGGKAYRLALLEAGHIAQNVLLVGTALGLGGLPICGFADAALARAVGLAHPVEAILYVIGVGCPGASAGS